jgi:nitrous oxidase accessory protein
MGTRLAIVSALVAASLLPGAASAVAAERTVAAGPGALAAAIETAGPGDVLRLGDGTFDGPVVVDRPLTLVGGRDTRVVGTGTGSVVTVRADDVTIEGLHVTGSGALLATQDSGIFIDKGFERTRILRNRIVGNLIGVDVQGARDVTIAGNTIVGRLDLRRNERGPGIYVWNAPGLTVEDNAIRRGRDGVFISTSSKAVYRNNTFSELRFAFHSMYANDIEVTGNVSRGNDLGFAFMFSRRIRAEGNRSVGDRTHGVFLNAVRDSVIAGNAVDGGEKCLFFYDAHKNRVADNRFEGCAIGIHFTAGSEKNVLTGNAFVGNRTQVKYVGTRWLEWSEGGRGNHWSDHAGFDVDGNGVADAPYRPNDVVDQLAWSQPMAKLLLGSPAVQLIKWSQSRFPGLLPGGVVDSHPLMHPGAAGGAPASALAAADGANQP